MLLLLGLGGLTPPRPEWPGAAAYGGVNPPHHVRQVLLQSRNRFWRLKNRFLRLKKRFSRLKNRFFRLNNRFSRFKNRFLSLKTNP